MPTRRKLANAIRALAMDAVQQAQSGHPGMPMGMADIAEVLWNDFLRHNPENPSWWDRDRFVVSNGHGSMLPYALLHLTGYDLPMQELKNFRQLHSKTPGHPEYRETPGIETTTGPLGQGLANAVGLALGERLLADRYNRDGLNIVDHRTWAFTGDGCLMEGISHEACSFAGTLGLGKLIVFYDDNDISIDGETDGWFRDNTPMRFKAYGWQVIPDVDGHDAEAVKAAVEAALDDGDRPTLICCKTVIGWGAPNKQGTASTHGAPLGDEEIAAARKELGWDHAPFEIPEEIYQGWNATERGQGQESAWQAQMGDYRVAHPELAAEFERRMKGELPENWQTHVSAYIGKTQAEGPEVASRKASGMAIEALAPVLPELVGGSADLTGSNNTNWSGSNDVMQRGPNANYIFYGVREFGMTALNNGLALHGGFIPYGGTFLVFSDYARNAVRMSALMGIRNIQVYTHDSIGLGEDGPTHQPIEHLASLRLIPNLSIWRPCDAVESAVAWKWAIESEQTPSCLVFTRQGIPHQRRDADQVSAIERGGYLLKEANDGRPKAIIIATGSEVGLAMQAAEKLEGEGVGVRVVSMPCCEVFDAQPVDYRESVLPTHVSARVAVEAGATGGWYRYVGTRGKVVGLDHFGASAPAKALFEEFGITAEAVHQAVRDLV